MSRSVFQKSIAATVGVAIASTGILVGIASHAQTGLPGTTPTTVPTTVPTAVPTALPSTPVQKPNGGSMTKPDATTTPGGMTKPAGKTIVNLVAGNKNFTILVKALKAADLVETLAGEGPYTVFAPTNSAFAKIPKATLANLLKPENKEQLKKVLTYHVVSGAVTSKMLKSGQQVDTVEGGKVTIEIKGKKIMVNKATVILANVKASNGVIHAIDTVLMPTN
jgi:uncharacterized surface protein with fasciclin (FAS1) repeats